MEKGGDSGGEAASLREAPLPQTPSPEEQLGIGLVFPSGIVRPCECVRFPCGLVVVTAADRAAATLRRENILPIKMQSRLDAFKL